MKTHKDLDVWKNAINFVTQLYQETQDFPSTERYGLTSQLRRSAVSVPSNLAEGFARRGAKERRQFLYIALGSNSEIETQLIIAENLNYLSETVAEELKKENQKIGRQLVNLIKYFENQ